MIKLLLTRGAVNDQNKLANFDLAKKPFHSRAYLLMCREIFVIDYGFAIQILHCCQILALFGNTLRDLDK